MPQILCPDCGNKRDAKLPSNHTLVSWKKAYGDNPAPFTCTQANIYNECVEKKATEKLAAELKQRREDYSNSRNLALTSEEVKELATNLGPMELGESLECEFRNKLRAKVNAFLAGDDTFMEVSSNGVQD